MLAWTNLLNLIRYQNLMLDFHRLINCQISPDRLQAPSTDH